jgi:hypothetical protein
MSGKPGWEAWHAVKDAVFYAKRIEEHAGYSPIEFLDEIDVQCVVYGPEGCLQEGQKIMTRILAMALSPVRP